MPKDLILSQTGFWMLNQLQKLPDTKEVAESYSPPQMILNLNDTEFATKYKVLSTAKFWFSFYSTYFSFVKH